MVTDECGRPIKQEVEYFGDEYIHNSEEKFDVLQGITSKNEFGPEQIKSEVIDIVYHDLKSERCLEEVKEDLHCEECGGRMLSSTGFFSTDNLQSCNCHARTGDDMTRDLKPLNFGADSGNFFHETQEDTLVKKGEELSNKNISSKLHGKLFGIKTVNSFEHGEKINEFSSGNYLSSVRDSSFHEESENCSKKLNEGKDAKFVENKHSEKLPVSSIESNIDIGSKPFQCTICSKSFFHSGHLKRHEKIHTGEKQFQCKICSKSFIQSCHLKSHEKIHTGEKSFQCKICYKFLTCKNSLRVHEKLHTSSIESSISKKHIDSFQCKFCSKLCYDSSHLTRHVRIHTGERPFQCKTCSKSFILKSDLKFHVRIHTGIKPSQCKICSKSFISGGNLRRHEKIHTGKKPFQCKICSKSFNQNGHLKTHEKIHTGERPFQCKICSKSFRQRGTLKTHEKIHTGERPFQCKTCSKSFIRRGHLKTHEKVHTGEKPFQCNICSKSFSRNTYLKIHEQKHTDQKPF